MSFPKLATERKIKHENTRKCNNNSRSGNEFEHCDTHKNLVIN